MMEVSDKFAWEWAIENGSLVEENPSYWSSTAITDPSLKKVKSFVAKINTVGVDWDKMKPLQDYCHQSFDSTFSDSSLDNYYLSGEIVLKDGTKKQWGVDAPGYGLGDMITNIFEYAMEKMKDD